MTSPKVTIVTLSNAFISTPSSTKFGVLYPHLCTLLPPCKASVVSVSAVRVVG